MDRQLAITIGHYYKYITKNQNVKLILEKFFKFFLVVIGLLPNAVLVRVRPPSLPTQGVCLSLGLLVYLMFAHSWITVLSLCPQAQSY